MWANVAAWYRYCLELWWQPDIVGLSDYCQCWGFQVLNHNGCVFWIKYNSIYYSGDFFPRSLRKSFLHLF